MEGSCPILRPLTHLIDPVVERSRQLFQSRRLRIATVDLLIIGIALSIISLLSILLSLYGFNPIKGIWTDRLYSWIGTLFFL